MNTVMLAIDDGLTNANYNMADVMFLLGMALAIIAGLGYAAGVGTIARRDDTPADGVPRTTATGAPSRYGWHYHLHQWAAALLAFSVACIAFALFLL